MIWSTRPFVRIFFFLVTGILISYWIPFIREINVSLLITILSIVCIIAFVLYKLNHSWKWRWINGLAFSLSVVLIRIFITNQVLEISSFHNNGKKEVFVAKVVSEPVETAESRKTILEILQHINSDTVNIKPFRAIAFFKKDSSTRQLQYGDQLVFSGKLVQPDVPKNPEEFNYAEYLALSDVHYMVYIRHGDWSLLGVSSNSIRSFAFKVRKYLLHALQENGVTGNDYAVAAAVLLGYDHLMESELEQDYVTAGAMHILCVSGLHVGIIYLVLNFVLGFLQRNKIQKIIKVILLLVLIWFYALLTGLSPSVLRASVMVSLFIIATVSSKHKDVYNTLASSAVILLLFNPLLVFNVGFQLSYSAVLGILLFYNPIFKIFYIKNKVLSKIWSIIAVSTAAQLGTFPLALHYFHFFPPYFWLTNIFIFPLSFAIIGAGMAFMVFSWLPVLSGIIGTMLSGFVYLLNYIVGLVKYLPFNGIHDVYYPWIKVALVYSLILLIVLFLILLFNTNHKYDVLNQKRLAIYSINKCSAYDFINGNNHALLVDSLFLKDDKKLNYHLDNSRISWGLDKNYSSIDINFESENLGLFYDGQFGGFGPHTFMRINDKIPFDAGNPIKFDFVIISGKKKIDLKQLIKLIRFDRLIIDSSVPWWKQKSLSEQAEELNLNYFNVSEQGAFLLEI